MNNNSKKLKLLLTFVTLLVVILIGSVLYINHQNSTEDVAITFKNIQDIKVYELSEHFDDEEGLISEVQRSGEIIKLRKGFSYTVSYKGAVGYEDGEVNFDVPGNKSININPYYSESKLNTLLDTETTTIHNVLASTYPAMSLYEIQRGSLYHWGEWYGTTLRYIGSDEANADTLRVILHKENGSWKIKTDPPYITLSKFVYPDIPEDVLSAVNNFQQAPLLEKFTTGR